ncbi:MAG TPA: Ig-like domain-containing protein [Burkholderiales bacterium]|nr:Ig-like domain-containing protein [Burkholderiales bacterium]
MKGKLGQSFVMTVLVAAVLALAASCAQDTGVGTGGAGTFGPGTGTGGGPPPGQGTVGTSGTRVQLLVSNPQLPSSGQTTVALTAVVLDANGQAVPGTTVTFSTGTDPSAFVSAISGGGTTDANGTVTATLNLGANKSNRTITVAVTTSDGATITNTVGVTGTAITISGNSSLAAGASTTLTFALKDSAGTPIPNMTMTLTSQNGSGIAAGSTLTDASGQVTATVTAAAVASDVITASAAGASKTQTLTIASAAFAFTTPAANTDIPLGSSVPLSVNWTNAGGGPVVGTQVSFTSSRGTVSGSPVLTNGTGDTPGVSISSASSAGPAIITAQGPGGTPAATLSVNFVATTATAVAVQAVPGVVEFTATPPNPSQTNNISTVTVTVRDANNNLVKNAAISFNLTDNTGGQLAANTAITDATGTASVNYTAGTTNSAQNGVVIQATVNAVNGNPIAPISASATLTVAGQALFVRVGTDNLVQTVPPPSPNLQKTWSAIVTDAAGNAVVGATVRFALVPKGYSKGSFVFATVDSQWEVSPDGLNPGPVIFCPSEDININGILDPGEDTNNNGRLDPGNVASVNATGTTDSNGIALATITYPKSYAVWTEVQLQASAGVVGNDPPTTATFFLMGLASDYVNKGVPPPGQPSPFGVVQDCTNPN